MYAIAAALGLVFGSFVTALSYRLPRGESIANGRSRCPSCGRTLTIRDLVPLISWIFHRGACRQCGARVSWRYPAIELTTAALFVLAAVFVRDAVQLGVLLLMTPVFVALAIIDLEYERLPNSLIVALALAATAWRWTEDGNVLLGLGVAALALGFGILIDAAYRARKDQNGLGLGDAKLLAVGGLALPLEPFLLFLSMAGLLGVVFGFVWQRATRKHGFPFGPAILSSFWICLVGGTAILHSLVSLLFG